MTQPDPLTNKNICSDCWNLKHQFCIGRPGCECYCQEPKPVKPRILKKDRQPPSIGFDGGGVDGETL